jgi:hypothetical protein
VADEPSPAKEKQSMTPRRPPTAVLAIALSGLFVVACDNSISTVNGGPGDQVTGDIGVTARDEVEASLSALTLPGSIDPLGTTQVAPSSGATASPGCVTPSTPLDSDGDGVPDDATYVFVAPPCRFTGFRGGTLDVVGQLRIQDPFPNQPGFGYEAALTNLRTLFVSSDNKVFNQVYRNGTRTLSGSVSSLVLMTELQVTRNFTGKPDAAVDQRWTVTFTPATSLQINLPLPSGGLEVEGTLDWTRGIEEHYVLTVSTPSPLHYNAGCTDTVQRIDGGEMQLAGTFGDLDGFVRLRWSECGREPSFSFQPTP